MQPEIQNQKSKILIVGAGPAGTSAAIRLAQQGYEVTLIEREKFPREKLCGEFISPECFRHFEDLGVLEKMFSAGGDRITETVFYAPSGKSVSVPSEWFSANESALGLSRAEMDSRLLERAKAVGVKVFEETQAIDLLIEDGKVGGIKAKNKDRESFEIVADLTIDASGRAAVLASLLKKAKGFSKAKGKRQKAKVGGNRELIANHRNRLVGFKTHVRNAVIEKGVCEIYFFRGGYGGLNMVENGLANHCFLIRADLVREFNSDAQQIVEKVIFQNKRACEALQNAAPVNDWLAVSVDNFGLKELNPAPNLLAIGDAGAFIDPFTGSGMLMALESGEILAKCLIENSITQQIIENYKFLHAQKFTKRLRICSLMRHAASAPRLADFVISALNFGTLPRKILARATRPNFLTSNK